MAPSSSKNTSAKTTKSEFTSAAYTGYVVHTRLRPKPHRLHYRVFSLSLELSELNLLDRSLRFFSVNRFNLLSFHERDHGQGDGTPLLAHVDERLAASGLDRAGGRVRLVCYPRLLGYVFNPLSVYFCDRPDGQPLAVIYEVSNTFGERVSYVLLAAAAQDGVLHQTCMKELFVSPFNRVEGSYAFHVRPPADITTIGIVYRDAAGPLLKAHFHGHREELSDRAILSLVLRYPLMTLKVIGAIHWEALRLYAKGIRLVAHQPVGAALSRPAFTEKPGRKPQPKPMLAETIPKEPA